MNNMAANMVKDYAFGKVRDQYEQNKGYFSFLSVEGLKVYFDVTNYYVLHKLKIILFPFLLKEDDWKRGQAVQSFSDGSFSTDAASEEEENCPRNDL